MSEHIRAALLALLIATTCACIACTSDDADGTWDLGDELPDADVTEDVDRSDSDAIVAPQTDADSDTEIGPPRCPSDEVEFPAETLPHAQLPTVLGDVPRIIWQEPLENYDGDRATPNGPLGAARGMDYDRPQVDVIYAPAYVPPIGDDVDWSYIFEFNVRNGESMGGSGSGGMSEGWEAQMDGLPATMLFPLEHLSVSFSASQSAPDGPSPNEAGNLGIDLSADGADGSGGYSYNYEAPGPGTMPLLSDAVMLPRGLAAILWDNQSVVALPSEMFVPGDGYAPFPTYQEWRIDLDELWPDAPQDVELAWLKSPSADEMIVLARHPQSDAAQPQPDRLFRIDACGHHERIFSGVGIGDEVLEVDGRYLIGIGAHEEDDTGFTPVLVTEEGVAATLDARCRDMVQTDDARFACLTRASDDEGFEVVHFDDELERVDTQPLGAPYLYARLWSAADNDGLVVLGLQEQDDQTRKADLVLVYSDHVDRLELPEGSQWEPSAADIDGAWPILTQRGVVALMWQTSILGIQTDLEGMAHTTYPRAHFGGNHNRGYVETAD